MCVYGTCFMSVVVNVWGLCECVESVGMFSV